MNRKESQECRTGFGAPLPSVLPTVAPCFCSPLEAGAHPAIYCSPFRNPASKNGAGWHQGNKMITELNRNESQESGVTLELLSPLFFLRSPPVFTPHLRLEPILQFTALHSGILHWKMGQVGIKGTKMILESMNEEKRIAQLHGRLHRTPPLRYSHFHPTSPFPTRGWKPHLGPFNFPFRRFTSTLRARRASGPSLITLNYSIVNPCV